MDDAVFRACREGNRPRMEHKELRTMPCFPSSFFGKQYMDDSDHFRMPFCAFVYSKFIKDPFLLDKEDLLKRNESIDSICNKLISFLNPIEVMLLDDLLAYQIYEIDKMILEYNKDDNDLILKAENFFEKLKQMAQKSEIYNNHIKKNTKNKFNPYLKFGNSLENINLEIFYKILLSEIIILSTKYNQMKNFNIKSFDLKESKVYISSENKEDEFYKSNYQNPLREIKHRLKFLKDQLEKERLIILNNYIEASSVGTKLILGLLNESLIKKYVRS